jgi:acylphosphatase
VRNRRDGTVEAVFAGPVDVVAAMIAKCHYGPSMAKVDAVDEQPSSTDELSLRIRGELFSVLPSI